MDDTWKSWTQRLAGELATLREHEFVNTSGPRVTEESPPGLFGRRRKPRVVSQPVVRFLGVGDHLLCETVVPYPAPDEPAVTDEQRGQLSAVGWLMPGDDGYETMGGPYCRVYLPISEAEAAARLAARTYPILGVASPDQVELERGR